MCFKQDFKVQSYEQFNPKSQIPYSPAQYEPSAVFILNSC